jgi:cobalt-zinc-cadmium efflux system membrane fusion protein
MPTHSNPFRRRLRTAPAMLAVALACLGATSVAVAAPLACLIEPSRMVDVGSPVMGVLELVHVDRGATVRKGQELARLQADVERASVQVAETRARAQAELQAAQSAADFARRKLERSIELEKKEFISPQAVEQARSESEIAEQRLIAAREQQRLSAGELGLARSQLAQRNIRSPIDGVVIERFMHEGERVDDRPILRVATLDPLRVEMVLPTQHLGQLKVGDLITITPEIAGSAAAIARVSMVDPVIDAASRTFRVRLDLPNPTREIQAGVRCTAKLAEPARAEASVANAKPVVPSAMVAPVRTVKR